MFIKFREDYDPLSAWYNIWHYVRVDNISSVRYNASSNVATVNMAEGNVISIDNIMWSEINNLFGGLV